MPTKAELYATIERLKQRLTNCQTISAAKDSEIQTLQQQVTADEVSINDLQAQVVSRDAQIADLQAQIKALTNPPPTVGPWYPPSPFNKKTSTAQHPNSANIIGRILAQGTFTKEHFGDYRTRADFSHPFYFAKDTDPVFTLRGGYGNSWKNPDVEGAQIHVPTWALPAGGSDGSMAIVQPDGWEYNLWLAQKPGQGDPTEIRCGFAKKVRHDGTGLQEGAEGGITAAGFANGLGVIRIEELVQGQINHALFIAVNGWHGRVYPGQSGGQHSGEVADPNAPAMGQLLRLNMAASEIQALSVPDWQKTVLTAMADFGMYVGDQSGSVIALQTESDVPYVARGAAPAGVAWAKQVGLPSSQQTLYDVDQSSNVQRTVYTMDWTKGVDWTKLQVLSPPAP